MGEILTVKELKTMANEIKVREPRGFAMIILVFELSFSCDDLRDLKVKEIEKLKTTEETKQFLNDFTKGREPEEFVFYTTQSKKAIVPVTKIKIYQEIKRIGGGIGFRDIAKLSTKIRKIDEMKAKIGG
jgi:hypothetical protein